MLLVVTARGGGRSGETREPFDATMRGAEQAGQDERETERQNRRWSPSGRPTDLNDLAVAQTEGARGAERGRRLVAVARDRRVERLERALGGGRLSGRGPVRPQSPAARVGASGGARGGGVGVGLGGRDGRDGDDAPRGRVLDRAAAGAWAGGPVARSVLSERWRWSAHRSSLASSQREDPALATEPPTRARSVSSCA